jgi:pimeloyl-ACP methyl ester carboxylesterase
MTAEPHQTLSRRHLLAGAFAAGSAAVLARAPGAAAASTTASAASTPATSFFADPAINFQMLFALGAAGYGAAETGEVLTAFDRIHSRGDTYRSVFEEFLALGRTLRARGDSQRAAGRTESARASYLRAAMYLDQALFFTLASTQPTRRHEGTIYREMEAAWTHAAALFRPRFQPVRIPYGRSHLPGWLLSPGGSTPRPTVILNNGSDAQNIDMFVYGGAAALERGWNALIFEGPGQGSNLFLHNRAFVPDWERVITPVVDWLRRQPGVDKRRISLVGQSFGGYLVARAAAFEHRLASVVPDPGVVDSFKTWSASLPPSLLELLYQGQRKQFNEIWNEIPSELPEGERFGIAKRVEIYGQGDGYEQLSLARKFVLTPELARRIEAPVGIVSPELEQFFPGQAEMLEHWLRGRKKLLRFTVAEGAQYHCEPMAPQLRNERVFDWLEANARPAC